jgi:hypothetical protein
MSTSRKASKKTPKRAASSSKRPRKTGKRQARTTRTNERKQLRFLVGDLAATRKTLGRLAKGFFDGWVSERELRVLTYALGQIGRMYVTEMELDIGARLDELEKAAKERYGGRLP